MLKYPFEHDGPVFMISDEVSETIYYARGLKFYKRGRIYGYPEWLSVREKEIDKDTFFMVKACIERKPRHV